MLDHFMTPRSLLCRGVPADSILSSQKSKADASKETAADPNSKAQQKKLKKLEAINAKKAAKAAEKEAASEVTAGVAALNVEKGAAAGNEANTSTKSS